jgi:hypothetical protein
MLSVPVDPCSSVAPGTRHLEFSIKRGLAWSRSTLLHQRGSALADLLKRPFETAKFFGAQFREHSLDLPGMLSKRGNDKVLATRGKGDDTNTSVFRALDPGYQACRPRQQDRAECERVPPGQHPAARQPYNDSRSLRDRRRGLYRTIARMTAPDWGSCEAGIPNLSRVASC